MYNNDHVNYNVLLQAGISRQPKANKDTTDRPSTKLLLHSKHRSIGIDGDSDSTLSPIKPNGDNGKSEQ